MFHLAITRRHLLQSGAFAAIAPSLGIAAGVAAAGPASAQSGTGEPVWRHALGMDLFQALVHYPGMGWMRYLPGDVATTVRALRQRGRPGVPSPTRAIFDFCVSFFTPMGYDYVDWKDLRPAWTAVLSFIRALPRLVRKGFTDTPQLQQPNAALASIADSYQGIVVGKLRLLHRGCQDHCDCFRPIFKCNELG